MFKVTLILGIIFAALLAESSCQKLFEPAVTPRLKAPKQKNVLILPTFRPPTRGKITRYVREISELTPLLNEKVNNFIPEQDHELQSNRPERSVDSPSAKRGGGHSTSSGSHDTGPTHPGYNRRNARSVDSPSARRGAPGPRPRTTSGSRITGPIHPGYNRSNAREFRPTIAAPVPRIPILARTARDIQISGLPKKHRDVIIPNWNPNARTNPSNGIGRRHGRSLDFIDHGSQSVAHEGQTNDTLLSPLLLMTKLKMHQYSDIYLI
ncbi:uncharacterized protein [Choristoneura fumiferana]|uniref:uncharacterized protein n=1 Tax=Choristoneura fumiferana TaxID=7141 RepID=UPI003D15AD70